MNRILLPGRNCRGIYNSDRSGLLVDGRNYYRAFYNAASQARRSILIAGWQFERSLPLLRGREAESAGGPVIMSDFLNELCARNQDLEIFILMWDFSAIVALDKEWFNKFVLELTVSERIHFRFDSRHALYASHHQKLVVIDGALAFVGGLDMSANGWDDRNHLAENPDRTLAGRQYEPYHDVVSFVAGPAAAELVRLFEQRWVHAGGEELRLPPPLPLANDRIGKCLPLAARTVGISVTRAQTLVPLLQPIMDIRQLYLDAIEAAEKLIYIETQYFSSQIVYEALRKKLTDPDRECPQVVIVLPRRLHTLIEDISLSVVQAKMLRSLTEIAGRHERPFGVYYSAAAGGDGRKATYIHSKVLLVDDRLLSVGSANITNRSMGMDTELNSSWEADGDSPEQVRSIRRVKANLLAEHTGLRKPSHRRAFASAHGLVQYLNRIAEREDCRLRTHTMESFVQDISWIRDLVPDDLSIDPERPIIEESIYEMIARDRNSMFAKGLLLLSELAMQQPESLLGAESAETGNEEQDRRKDPSAERNLDESGQVLWYAVAIAIVCVLIVWLIFDA